MDVTKVKPGITTGEQRAEVVDDYLNFRKELPGIFLDGTLRPAEIAAMEISDVEPLTSLHLPEQLYPFLYVARAMGVKKYAEIGVFSGGTLKLVVESCDPMERVFAHDVYPMDWRMGSWFVVHQRDHGMHYASGRLVEDDGINERLAESVREHVLYDLSFVDGRYSGSPKKIAFDLALDVGSCVALHDVRGDVQVMSIWESFKEEQHQNYHLFEFDTVGDDRPSWKRCGIGLAVSRQWLSQRGLSVEVLRTIKDIVDP